MAVSKRFILSLLGSIAWWTGVALSITLYLIVAQMVTEKNEATFEHQVNHASLAVQSRVRSSIDVLHGVRALFSAKNDVTRAEFHAYVEQLQARKNFPRVNKAFMAYGVEGRLPFLDPDVVDLALSLPQAAVQDGRARPKAVLQRASLGRLPDSVTTRPKVAFQDGMGLKAAIGRR